MYQSKKSLQSQIKILEKELQEYKERAVGDKKLGKCVSNQCLDCKYAVTSGGSYFRVLLGCAKDCVCEDYEPIEDR